MAQFSDEKQAKQTIERWRASGLGVVQFAKREGISVRTFYRMRERADATDPLLVPVVVRSATTPASPAPPFEVELAGMKIRIGVGFDAAELVRLVETLRRVRC